MNNEPFSSYHAASAHDRNKSAQAMTWRFSAGRRSQWNSFRWRPSTFFIHSFMKNLIILAALLPLLALSERAAAIEITFQQALTISETRVGANPIIMGNADVSNVPIAALNSGSSFADSTSAPLSSENMSNTGSMSFTNTPTVAVLTASDILHNGNSDPRGTFLSAGHSFVFTLTEQVDYTIAGNMSGTLLDDGRASISNIRLRGHPAADATTFYVDNFTTNTPGGFSLQVDNTPALGSPIGTLPPGQYSFEWTNTIVSQGSTQSSLSLTLTPYNYQEPPGPTPVPDAGSTLMLLGGALSALGMVRRFVV